MCKIFCTNELGLQYYILPRVYFCAIKIIVNKLRFRQHENLLCAGALDERDSLVVNRRQSVGLVVSVEQGDLSHDSQSPSEKYAVTGLEQRAPSRQIW